MDMLVIGAGFALVAFLLGFIFGNMVGKALGFADAQRQFDEEREQPRDARGRFIKRK